MIVRLSWIKFSSPVHAVSVLSNKEHVMTLMENILPKKFICVIYKM